MVRATVQDVPFMAVVPLGCVFQLTGRVVYTDGPVVSSWKFLQATFQAAFGLY